MSELKGIEYNGKMYVPVIERVRYFREKHPTWSILTEIKLYAERVGDLVVAQASITNETGGIVATGHASTVAGMGRGPAGDATIEYTETKAIGRALACFGIPGGEYASADEMWAILSQKTEAEVPEKKEVSALGEAAKAIMKFVEKQDSETLRTYWEDNKPLIDDIKKSEPESYKELVKRFKARKLELEKDVDNVEL